MTVQTIKSILYSHYANSDYKLFNTYIFDFESDFFCMSKSGYAIECEIKVSRSDFFADFKKSDGNKNKHEILQNKEKTFKPNRFYFAVPSGLITTEEVPKYAGLIYISDYNFYLVKEAPFLHKQKLMNNIYFVKQLMHKYYYRCMDLRKEMSLRESDLRYGQGRFDKKY